MAGVVSARAVARMDCTRYRACPHHINCMVDIVTCWPNTSVDRRTAEGASLTAQWLRVQVLLLIFRVEREGTVYVL